MLVVVPVFLLAGCTMATGSDGDSTQAGDLADWMASHENGAKSQPDLLGELYAPIDAGSNADDGGMTLTFAKPVAVDHMTLSCFGDGQLSGSVKTAYGATSLSKPVGPFSCAKSPIRIDLDLVRGEQVSKVGFAATHSSIESAWQVDVFSAG